MTENQESVTEKKEAKKQSDPATAVPRAEKKKKQPSKKKASAAKKTNGKKEAAASKKEPEKAKETKVETPSAAPLSGCKVFGQPDPHHKKCRICKDLEQCLAIDIQRKESKPKRKTADQRGRDFIGFLKGSSKSMFALQIAKNPCHMREVKDAPWNKRKLTCYDTFNQLRRNVDEKGEAKPLAMKDKEGTMFILEANLTKEQRDKMKEEVKEFPY